MTDLLEALAKGVADFKAMPTHLVFLCVIYPIVMLVGARVYAGYDVLPLVFPLLAGYTLIGPLIATGMYELSRRRELGLDISRLHAFDVLRSRSIRPIATLGIFLMVVYFIWMFVAQAIYNMVFGGVVPESIGGFAQQVFATPSGLILIVVGSAVGFVFAHPGGRLLAHLRRPGDRVAGARPCDLAYLSQGRGGLTRSTRRLNPGDLYVVA